ncbi:hypothetical protein PsorP6_002017 [Peronosclerospora sorghi]|uniref:Uncharacterized protein n=1 Tax=Peronosclerospora sorghi TaxID=230839 RepID=A0ACC0WWT4_9STRA|nr:hypothetical protein PsorP6_002017 [Peronosclerospora sorghi]
MSEAGMEPDASTCSNRSTEKSKRLLPKELRKRRRLAKLQVTEENQTLHSSQDTSTSVRLIQEVQEASESDLDAPNGPQEKQKDAAGSPSMAAETSPSLPHADQKLPPATVATALNSLYTLPLLGAKKQPQSSASVQTIFRVADLPPDAVPKAKVSILTALPYPFLRVKYSLSGCISSQIKKQALQRFVAVSDKSATQHPSSSNAMRWQQALHYFAYPADSLTTAKLLHRTRGPTHTLVLDPPDERKREEESLLMARWNSWQEAFRDVYMNFRRQKFDGEFDSPFYVRSSDFVVYFQYKTNSGRAASSLESIGSIIDLCRQHDPLTKDVNVQVGNKTNQQKLCAVMSQSSKKTRKILHHLNVKYVMPYVNTNQTQREAGEFDMLAEKLEGDLRGNECTNGNESVGRALETIHRADSLLLFHGHDAVHGLYEFLINRAPKWSQDIPELYALYPFAHASIRSLRVKSFGRVGGALDESLPQDELSNSSTLFRIEISGFCFPVSIASMLAVLKDEWEAVRSSENFMPSSPTEKPIADGTLKNQIALRTYMEAVTGAERLNAVNLDAQVANSGSQEDHRMRQQELEFSKKRVEVVVVTKMESTYNVEISSTRP